MKHVVSTLSSILFAIACSGCVNQPVPAVAPAPESAPESESALESTSAGSAKVTIDGQPVDGPPFVVKITGNRKGPGGPVRAEYTLAGDVTLAKSVWPQSSKARQGLPLKSDTVTITITSRTGKYFDHQTIRARITEEGHTIKFEGRFVPLSIPEKGIMSISAVDYSKQIDGKYRSRTIFEHAIEFVR